MAEDFVGGAAEPAVEHGGVDLAKIGRVGEVLPDVEREVGGGAVEASANFGAHDE